MVLAGPLFLLSQTRAFYQANREPLLRLGLGTLSAYLGLMLLSKSYESTKMLEEIEGHVRRQQALSSRLLNPRWIKQTVQLLSTPSTSSSSTGSSTASLSTTKSTTTPEQILQHEIEQVIKLVIQEVNEELKQSNKLPDIRLPYTDNLQTAQNKATTITIGNSRTTTPSTIPDTSSSTHTATLSVNTNKTMNKGDNNVNSSTAALPKRNLI